MKELTDKFWPFVRVLFLPYIFIMFVLIYPINYGIFNPGGLTEVKNLITIDYNQDKVVTGSISSTYVIDIKRPSFFEFIAASFSPYRTVYALPDTYDSTDQQNDNIINTIYKKQSVDMSIYWAYKEAEAAYPEDIQATLIDEYYISSEEDYLNADKDITLGDIFVSVVGDNGVVTDLSQIADNTQNSTTYEWTFQDLDGKNFTVNITKNPETNKFGLSFARYQAIDQENTFPTYSLADTHIGGPSGGLMQALAIYNMLVPEDITHGLKIAGTGTIQDNGDVGPIGAVEQKIATAYLNNVDVFFIQTKKEDAPDGSYDNYAEALDACEKLGIDPSGWLVPVTTFQQALDYLDSLGGQS